MAILKRFEETDTIKLAVLLNEDEALRLDMGFPAGSYITPRDARRKIQKWERAERSVCFSIMEGYSFVGLFSLSHVKGMAGTARVGCWIGSSYRNRGICSEAFGLLLQEARDRGISRLSATIRKDNHYLQAIWDGAGGRSETDSEGRLHYELDIPSGS